MTHDISGPSHLIIGDLRQSDSHHNRQKEQSRKHYIVFENVSFKKQYNNVRDNEGEKHTLTPYLKTSNFVALTRYEELRC
jgi:hypothetical protein